MQHGKLGEGNRPELVPVLCGYVFVCLLYVCFVSIGAKGGGMAVMLYVSFPFKVKELPPP